MSVRAGGGYAIEVPESVVRAAGDTLVIDPVIASGSAITNPPMRLVSADTAYVGTASRFVAVERAFSSSDSDVLVYRLPAVAGIPATFVATIDLSSDNWEDPAITGTNTTGDIMVVATRGLGTGRRIYGRQTRIDGLSVGPQFLVSGLFAEGFDNACRSEDEGTEDQTGVATCLDSGLQTGTSFASPNMAGAAAVVQDFFQKGFYPDGTDQNPTNSSDLVNALSGHGVRAVLIASTIPITGGRNFMPPDRFK